MKILRPLAAGRFIRIIARQIHRPDLDTQRKFKDIKAISTLKCSKNRMKDINKYISTLLLQSHGIDISKYNESFLSKSFRQRITETRYNSEKAYCKVLEQNKMEAEFFLESLHNSYTEFFRNPLTFSVLERIILSLLLLKKKNAKNKEIRIWSAACAGGQEAYSLAILLEELKNNDTEKLNYRIFATDQRESQVSEARKGTYSDIALNNLNMRRVKDWFTKNSDTYTVKPELKEHIDFSVFDLFSEHLSAPPASIFGDFDLVVCANLLFYYKPEYQKLIVEKTGSSLADNAYLVVGETEREILIKHNYYEAFPQSGIFQNKNKKQ
jgi:chemotaxis protein methyltransferase CheR